MNMPVSRAIAAVGDVADPRAWSGTPYHFWIAAKRATFASYPICLRLETLVWRRRAWATARLLSLQKPAGFQYSTWFLDRAEAQIPREWLAGELISLSQHFPRARTVRRAGGRISYYIDATFAALSSGRGLDLDLPHDVVKRASALEQENYELAERVVTMARWAHESVVADCRIPPEKAFTILPGANIEPPPHWLPPSRQPGRAGRDRPFVLGFVGKDWRRKGLPVVCEIRDRLVERGWQTIVRAAGEAPTSLSAREGIQFIGFVDKRKGSESFLEFLTSCDVGCLFSTREALGISTLEFLRAGVPVAGYAIEGPADTLPADAGFRFSKEATIAEIVDRFEAYLKSEDEQADFAAAARKHSALLTWDRCVQEFQRLWTGDRFEAFKLPISCQQLRRCPAPVTP